MHLVKIEEYDGQKLNNNDLILALCLSIESSSINALISLGEAYVLNDKFDFQFRKKFSKYIKEVKEEGISLFIYFTSRRSLKIKLHCLQLLATPEYQDVNFILYIPRGEHIYRSDIHICIDDLKQKLNKLTLKLRYVKNRRKFTSEDRFLSSTKQANEARSWLADQYSFDLNVIINEIITDVKVYTLQSIANELNKRGYKTRQGKQFSPASVSRIQQRSAKFLL